MLKFRNAAIHFTPYLMYFLFPGSPLIFVIRALLNLNCGRSNQNDASYMASYLLGIFLAIQKADDAVDAKFTPVCSCLSCSEIIFLVSCLCRYWFLV